MGGIIIITTDRYCIKNNRLYDNRSMSYIPFDLYWIVDLLNLKEGMINELQEELHSTNANR